MLLSLRFVSVYVLVPQWLCGQHHKLAINQRVMVVSSSPVGECYSIYSTPYAQASANPVMMSTYMHELRKQMPNCPCLTSLAVLRLLWTLKGSEASHCEICVTAQVPEWCIKVLSMMAVRLLVCFTLLLSCFVYVTKEHMDTIITCL